MFEPWRGFDILVSLVCSASGNLNIANLVGLFAASICPILSMRLWLEVMAPFGRSACVELDSLFPVWRKRVANKSMTIRRVFRIPCAMPSRPDTVDAFWPNLVAFDVSVAKI